MKIDIKMVAPFLNAFINVAKQVIQVDVKRKEIKAEDKFTVDGDVVIIVGITGDIKGDVAYSFNKEVAKKIASKMMMGMPVEELDDISKSALNELANMITGNACLGLSKLKIKTDVSIPTFISGENVDIYIKNANVIKAVFESELGEMEIKIATN